jgi:heptaprenyl diphosphate synthase
MMRFWEDQPELSRELEMVRDAILLRSASDDPDVRTALGQLLASSGKMLRPAFVLLASRFGTPDVDRMIRIAAAVEMLHMATLVHDDIIDAAPLRRGVATLQALRGPRTAVLVGDWLFASCFSLIADLAGSENGRVLSRLVARICGSEISQSSDKFVLHTSVRRYLRRIAGKTAALFALAFHVGAVESSCDEKHVSSLRRLGYNLGMGFQIIDDVLDFEEAGTETGKLTGGDLAGGIYTLPTILALQSDDGELARALRRRPRSRRGLARAAALITQRGGLAGARTLAGRHTERSRREICRLPDGDARRILETVAEKLLRRTY